MIRGKKKKKKKKKQGECPLHQAYTFITLPFLNKENT